jgi:hypothetical protein
MPSTDQERVNALWAAQQAAADERDADLIDAFVEDVRPLRDSHRGGPVAARTSRACRSRHRQVRSSTA